MSTDEYVPSDEDMENRYVLWSLSLMDTTPENREAWAEKLRAEFRRGLTCVRRDAAKVAWDEGHSWGWSDAQDAHDVRQAMDRADWPLSTPNPYRQEVDR